MNAEIERWFLCSWCENLIKLREDEDEIINFENNNNNNNNNDEYNNENEEKEEKWKDEKHISDFKTFLNNWKNNNNLYPRWRISSFKEAKVVIKNEENKKTEFFNTDKQILKKCKTCSKAMIDSQLLPFKSLIIDRKQTTMCGTCSSFSQLNFRFACGCVMCGICFNILIYTRMKSENLSLYFHHPGHETLSELLSNYSTLCDKQHIEYGERNQGISLNHLYIFPSLYYMIKKLIKFHMQFFGKFHCPNVNCKLPFLYCPPEIFSNNSSVSFPNVCYNCNSSYFIHISRSPVYSISTSLSK